VRQKVDGYSSGCGCLWVRGGGRDEPQVEPYTVHTVHI
jgi:hypothetical protein